MHGSLREFVYDNNLYLRTREKIRVFKKNFLSYEALNDPNFLPEHDYNRTEFLNDLSITRIQGISAKIYYKKVLWKITIVFSVFCLFLTYISQWCVIPHIPKNHTFFQYLMWGLFLFGTYSCDQTSLLSNIYPYYILIILNFIELRSILFLEEKLQEQMKKLNLISIKLKDDFFLPIKTVSEGSLHFQTKSSKDCESFANKNTQNIIYKSNKYFVNHAKSLKCDSFICFLYVIEKVYLIVFLINSDINYSLFSMITFLTIAYLSISRYYPMNILRVLNTCSLLLLMIRYPLFLMNINAKTNPRHIPFELQELLNFNLVDYLFEKSGFSKNMIDYCKYYLALGEKDYDHVSFFINSIIIYTFQIYFIWMLFAFKKIYAYIEKQTTKIEENAWNPVQEYKKWTGMGLKLISAIHSFLYKNLYLLILFLIAYLLIFNTSEFNFILFVFIMIFLAANEIFLSHVNLIKHQKIIKIILRMILIYLIFLLFATQVSHIPILMEDCIAMYPCKIIFSISIWDKILSIIIIKFPLDLMSNENYLEVVSEYLLKKNFRAKVIKTCIAYDFNDGKIKSWLEKLEDKLILKEHIRFVVQKLEYWHSKYFSSDPKVKIVTEKGENEQIKQKEKEKETQKEEIKTLLKSGKKGVKLKIFEFLQKKKDKFMFQNILSLVNFLFMKNSNLISEQKIDLNDYIFLKFGKIERTLSYLDHFHSKFIKTLKNRLQNIEILQNLNSSEEQLEKFFFLVHEEIKNYLKAEYPKENLKNLGTGKLLVQQPNNEGFIDLKQFEEGGINQNPNPSIFTILINMFEVLMSHWDVVCHMFLIFYIFWNTGLICIVLPLYLFGFLLIEEKNAKAINWIILLLYFMTICILKFVFKLGGMINDFNVSLAFGTKIHSMDYEFFVIVFLTIQINILRMKGIDKNSVSEKENIYQSFFRVIIF